MALWKEKNRFGIIPRILELNGDTPAIVFIEKCIV